jgi:hypothetical protein
MSGIAIEFPTIPGRHATFATCSIELSVLISRIISDDA